jgi:hypothetical protein
LLWSFAGFLEGQKYHISTISSWGWRWRSLLFWLRVWVEWKHQQSCHCGTVGD